MIYEYKSGFSESIIIRGPSLQELIDAPKPILWNNAGMYFLYPIQVIKNVVKQHEHNADIAFNEGHKFLNEITLHWNQAGYLESSVAKKIKTIPI